jgi:hypothetical protein
LRSFAAVKKKLPLERKLCRSSTQHCAAVQAMGFAALYSSYVVGPFAELRCSNRLGLNGRYLQFSIIHRVGSGVQAVPQQARLDRFVSAPKPNSSFGDVCRAFAIRTSVARSGSFLPVT